MLYPGPFKRRFNTGFRKQLYKEPRSQKPFRPASRKDLSRHLPSARINSNHNRARRE
jgi:hypothetical protein